MDLIMLKPIQVKEMIENNQFDLIIDLRDNENYHKGHLPGAINIPINEITDKLNFLDLYKKKSIILYCGIGSKSISAGKVLIINGFEKIYSLSNGIKGYKYELKSN
ncbi:MULTISPECIES: rhodanese-like domain-containing protein [Clostridia]|uniref:rhodanese-like domain-containing protein n=1 Tax=Clostridium sp. CCUG 7971 TaxID=2811414 RepID=UPI001ABAFD89|nr:rhodanese-like domain-containing protein [Clostridium sp. CCUG 7971]MBO3443240.1 rhodanese-like domain-containing protein [Clostridium sp. CCUG 7971]